MKHSSPGGNNGSRLMSEEVKHNRHRKSSNIHVGVLDDCMVYDARFFIRYCKVFGPVNAIN